MIIDDPGISISGDDQLEFINFNDFNGDGYPEFSFDKYTMYNFVKPLPKKENLHVKSIINGLNQQICFDYKPITSNDVYSETTQSYVFPVSKIRAPIYVVSQMETYFGYFFDFNTFRYKNARIHKQGKGFLGFEEVESRNYNQNRKITTKYGYNSTYYNVYPVKQTVSTYAGSPIFTTSYLNSYFTTGNDQIFPYVKEQETTDHLTGLNQKVEYTYIWGSYGNPKKITETCGSLVTETENTWDFRSDIHKCYQTKQVVTKKGLGQNFTQTNTFTYDDKVRPATKVEFSGHAKAVTTTYSNYDVFGNPRATTTSASGCHTITNSCAFDPTGRFVTSQTDALGNTSYAYYDSKTGAVSEKKDMAGISTYYQYDGFGRLVQEQTPTDVVTYTQAWDNTGYDYLFRIDATSQITGTQSTWYNRAGKEIKKQTQGFSGPVVTEKKYNWEGRLFREYLPGYNNASTQYIEYAYDGYGRLQKETNIGRATSYAYSKLTTSVTTPDSKTKSTTLNSSGLTAYSIDIMGDSVIYTYNSLGKPVTTTANGISSTITYDDRGYQQTLKDANITNAIQYVYDAYGQMTSQTSARGQTTLMQYDVAGRVTSETDPERALSYEYILSGYGMGQLQYIKENGTVINSFTYNYLGQPVTTTEKIDNVDYTVSYNYDSRGQLQEKTSPSGLRVSYQYNNGQLVSMRNAENNALLWQADAVNALGQITESTMGNGLKRISGYDTYHLPNQIMLKNGSSVIDQVNYVFNATTGNLSQRNDVTLGRNETFGYDNLNRLNAVTLNNVSNLSMDYFSNGNIQTKSDVGTYQYDNDNHALSGITGKAANYNPAALDFTNTSYNRVSSITQQGSTVKKLNLYYNAGNQRRKTQYYENSVLKKTMYYSGNYEKEIPVSSATKEYDYIYTPEGLSAISIKTNGTRSFYYTQTDHLGSIRVVTTASRGIQTRYYYDSWGKQTLYSGTSVTNRGYIGEEHLNDFGLINLNARMYDPVLGRFMGVDPYIQEPDFTQSHNRYSYGMNNPMSYVDPGGEIPVLVAVGIVAAFVYLYNAHSNTPEGKDKGNPKNWAWNPRDWFRKDGKGAVVNMGYNTGGDVTVSVGIGNPNGLIPVVGYSSQYGTGAGISYNGNSSLYYPGYESNVNNSIQQSVDRAIENARISVGAGMEYSNKYINDFANQYFPKHIDLVDNIYADWSLGSSKYERDGDYVYGFGERIGAFYSIKENSIYMFKECFTSREQLYLDLGHELIHASYYNRFKEPISSFTQEYMIARWEADQKKAWGMPYEIPGNSHLYHKDYDYRNFGFKIRKTRPWVK